MTVPPSSFGGGLSREVSSSSRVGVVPSHHMKYGAGVLQRVNSGDLRASLFLDFDGTLVESNVAMDLVAQFGKDGRRVADAVDRELHAGRMNLREAWEREAALLPWDRIPEMVEFAVTHTRWRPGAQELVTGAQERGWFVAVVSGGLDFYILPLLSRAGIRLPVFSDRIGEAQGGSLQVVHPFQHPTCRLCGICKAGIVRERTAKNGIGIFVGDGSTDRYAAEVADIIFARRRLLSICQGRGQPVIPFDDLRQVAEALWAWSADPMLLPRVRRPGFPESACPISRETHRDWSPHEP